MGRATELYQVKSGAAFARLFPLTQRRRAMADEVTRNKTTDETDAPVDPGERPQ